MEENRQEYDNYDNTEFEEDYTPRPDSGKSIRGYRIVIIILSVILVAISALYFGIHRQQMLDNERGRADSLMNQLRKERRWSLAKIKQYEKEVGTLRTVMRGYLHQIDSLNSLNQKLITENISYRKEISSATLRAEMAEEKAAELDNKVRAATRRFRASATPSACAWTSC